MMSLDLKKTQSSEERKDCRILHEFRFNAKEKKSLASNEER
jgi:hypothetical protein